MASISYGRDLSIHEFWLQLFTILLLRSDRFLLRHMAMEQAMIEELFVGFVIMLIVISVVKVNLARRCLHVGYKIH